MSNEWNYEYGGIKKRSAWSKFKLLLTAAWFIPVMGCYLVYNYFRTRRMKYKLNKTIGRDQIPGDEIAFNRLTEVFRNHEGPVSSQRRRRVKRSDGKTELSQEGAVDIKVEE